MTPAFLRDTQGDTDAKLWWDESHDQSSHVHTTLTCLLFIPSAFWWMANMPAMYSFTQLAFRWSEFSHSVQHRLPFAKAFPLTSLGVPDCRWQDLPVCVSLKKTSSRFLQPSNTLFWVEKFSLTALQCIQETAPASFHLHDFQSEVSCHPFRLFFCASLGFAGHV